MGLGTDTYPHNMLDEMRLAAYLARTQATDPRTLTTTDLFEAATTGGASALGRDDIGRLAAGLPRRHRAGRHHPPDDAAGPRPAAQPDLRRRRPRVQAVYVDGHKVVENGEVLTMDYRAAAAHLNEAQKRIEARVPELDWAHRPAEQIAPSTFRWS